MQLDACLKTFVLNCSDSGRCRKRVILKCSDARHTAQYSLLRQEHPEVEFIAESDFHQDLEAALSGFDHVLFMVDDNLFVRLFRLGDVLSALASQPSAIGFSLRLGRNIELCYSHDDAPQKMPDAAEIEPAETERAGDRDQTAGKRLRFAWEGAPYDFGYPLEVSSSVFRTSQILSLIGSGDRIKNPNALEARMDSEKGRFAHSHPDLLCFERSVAFCNPMNVVQHDYPNRARGDAASSVNSLMDRFEMGYRIDVKGLAGFTPHGCHQEKETVFVPPRLEWEKIRVALQVNYEGAGAEGIEAIQPRTVQCEIETRNLADDSLQSVLTALRLLGAAQGEAAASWVETLGKCHRESLDLQSHEFASAAVAWKERLANLVKDSQEQRTAIDGQHATMDYQRKEIAEQDSVIKGLNEQLDCEIRSRAAVQQKLDSARWELAQIRKKWWFRLGDKIGKMLSSVQRTLGAMRSEANRRFPVNDYARGWILSAHARRGLTVQDSKALFHLDESSKDSDGRFHFRGWLLLKQGRAATKVRAEAFAPGKYRQFPAVIPAGPDATPHLNAGRDADNSGFEIKGWLPGIRSWVRLQYFCDGKWLTFARFTSPGTASPQPLPRPGMWPKEAPLVSVVIPCHNYGKYLMEAVDSVLAQTWLDLEVIVVDDGSDDADTIRILENLRTPRTRVIRQQNLGLPSARNTGITAAAGKYICCLDADDMLEPTYIEKCLVHLVIGGFDICGSWQRNFGIEDAVHRPGNFDFENLLEANQMINSAMFPRRLWEAAGGFDTTMVDGGEDWDFWIRMASLGAQATVIPEPLFLDRKHGRSMIDATMEKHGAIVRRIRGKHRQIIPTLQTRTPKNNRWTELLGRGVTAGTPRVLVCLPFLTIGGAEKILSQICLKLRANGFHFTIITTEKAHPSHGDSASWFGAATTEIFRLPDFVEPASWSGFIAYLICSRQTDILWQAGSAFIYNLLPDLKTIFPELKVVDILFNEVGHTANNRKYDYLIDLHVTESQSTKAWLIAQGESEDRVRVIPNGVDLSSWHGLRPEPMPFESGGRRFIVGFFGRLSQEKGPDLFVRIAERLRDEKDILFIIGGHGPMEGAVRQQISEAGLDESVKLLGFCPTQTHLPCCDVLAVPSRQDGRPNIVMEAMAMGVPVIAFNVGGMSELVQEGYSGFLCDAADIGQFAQTISMLFHDPILCEKLGASTQLHAREHFDIGKTVAGFTGAFREIVRRPSFARIVETTAA